MSRPLLRAVSVLGAVFLAAGSLTADAQPARAAPGGYWEGKATSNETPMKDANKSLTRKVEAEFWFTVSWDPATRTGTLAGEAQGVYDSVLKVENLPKVTAAVPGGNVKFEPSVGGRLEGDNKRKFPIVGVISVDPATGNGTLLLRKVDMRDGVSLDKPMDFIMRADPGVSGGISKGGASINYSGGTVSGGVESKGGAKGDSKTTTGQGVNTGINTNVIVKTIPMTPFSPFTSAPGLVSKRPDGPFVATFEDSGERHSIKWSAKQMGGEQRAGMRLTPEMQRLIEELLLQLRNQRR